MLCEKNNLQMQLSDFEDEESIKALQTIMGSFKSKNKPLKSGFCKRCGSYKLIGWGGYGRNVRHMYVNGERVRAERFRCQTAQVFLGSKDLGIVKTSQYTGERLWNLNPGVRGHFPVPSEVVESTESLEIRVSVTVIDQYERKHQLLPLAWVYMRDRNWYLEPCGNDT
ncbi:MAG: hypothetical protein KJ714_00995 [Euryarchaeota archaeon]|nr:hypothetical protein [Euryarchaeota archaeon]